MHTRITFCDSIGVFVIFREFSPKECNSSRIVVDIMHKGDSLRIEINLSNFFFLPRPVWVPRRPYVYIPVVSKYSIYTGQALSVACAIRAIYILVFSSISMCSVYRQTRVCPVRILTLKKYVYIIIQVIYSTGRTLVYILVAYLASPHTGQYLRYPILLRTRRCNVNFDIKQCDLNRNMTSYLFNP